MGISNAFKEYNYGPKNVQTRAIDGETHVIGRNGGIFTGKEVAFKDYGELKGSPLENVPPVRMGKFVSAMTTVDDKVFTIKNLASGLKPVFKLAVAGAAGYGLWVLSHLLFGSVMHLNPHLTLALSITAVALIPAAALLLMGMSTYGKIQSGKQTAQKQNAAFEARNAAQKAVNNASMSQNSYKAQMPPVMNQYAY